MDLEDRFINNFPRVVSEDRKGYIVLKSNVFPEESDGCWWFVGSKNKHGYGLLVYKNKSYYAHRRSWEAFNGDIQDGLCVLHKCDNPSCVNPDHLFLGTRKDNIIDKVNKGRQSSLFGEKNKASKLTEEKVKEIRSKYIPKKYTYKMLSKEFNVSLCTIRDVIKRNTWGDLDEN